MDYRSVNPGSESPSERSTPHLHHLDWFRRGLVARLTPETPAIRGKNATPCHASAPPWPASARIWPAAAASSRAPPMWAVGPLDTRPAASTRRSTRPMWAPIVGHRAAVCIAMPIKRHPFCKTKRSRSPVAHQAMPRLAQRYPACRETRPPNHPHEPDALRAN